MGANKPEGSTEDDFDGDGIPNLQEYLMGHVLFNPLDLNGDRILDTDEEEHPGVLSKLRFADAVEDVDDGGLGDGVMNHEELLLRLEPAVGHSSGVTGLASDADVLLLALLRGGPLLPVSDPVLATWQAIDAAWFIAQDMSPDPAENYYAHWLEPDGLADFALEFWAVGMGYGGVPSEDHDYDGMPNLWEYRYELDLHDASDAGEDPDHDSLTNLQEYVRGTNPRLADSDGDGFSDSEEVQYGSDPLQQNSQPTPVLARVSGGTVSVPAGQRSTPLTVMVSRGGHPVAGVAVAFEIVTDAGLLADGSLHGGYAAASTGQTMTLMSGGNGMATVSYQAGAGTGDASVKASLVNDGVQNVAFALGVVAPPQPGLVFGTPFGGGAFGGSGTGENSGSNQAPTLRKTYKSMQAQYGEVTYQTKTTKSFLGYLKRGDEPVKVYDSDHDETTGVVSRYTAETLGVYTYSSPEIVPAYFSRIYSASAPESPDKYESEGQYRHAVGLQVDKLPSGEQPEMTILALVYKNDGSAQPNQSAPGNPSTIGTIQVKGAASTWSTNLAPYCYRRGDTVIVDPGTAGAAEIGKGKTGFVDVRLVAVEIEQHEYSHNGGIRFCRWLDSFANGGFDNQAADNDRDRFRIKIAGNVPNLTKARIKATDLHGAVIGGQFVSKTTDGDYEVEMKAEGGSMVSTPILLVSDGEDDKSYNGKGTDDGTDDQTLLADFESTIIVTFPELHNAQAEFTAQKAVGEITVNLIYGSVAGDVPNDIREAIYIQAHKMREIYRQIGIKVKFAALNGVQIPAAWLAPRGPASDPALWEKADHLSFSEGGSFMGILKTYSVPAKQIRVGFVNASLESPSFQNVVLRGI